MKKGIILSLALILSACSDKSSSKVKFVENPQIQALGAGKIKDFISGVKGHLESVMKSDPSGVNGMNMCSVDAMRLTSEYNKMIADSNVTIRRSALKYRNEANKPDVTDEVVMNKFVESKNFEKPLVVEMRDSYRVYKALPTMKPCLACHGENIKPEVQALITKSYPKDLASGFKEGDFRGVVIAEIKK
ncbi:MAG: DUF3365 domain-containing protein [Epsilonproteobacteria bacterium]|nr:DUF3365 domain-containing protein [Campylobacterota bacterium]